MLKELNQRAREIMRLIVEAYVETGEPIGSRTLARRLDTRLSPASIRNVMSDLEAAGFLYAPHTSAGRLPTDAGLRFFVDGLLEVGNITDDEREAIGARCSAHGRSMEEVLTDATTLLSGLSDCAGLVVAPKIDTRLKQAELVSLGDGRALVILVGEDGSVENRLFDLPLGLGPSALTEASNYLSVRLDGRTLGEARQSIFEELETRRAELDQLTARAVEAGLATLAGDHSRQTLIIRGQAKLLDDIHALDDLERIRELFDELERSQGILELLDLAAGAEGVHIYIGSENKLFSLSGCSMVVAPYSDKQNKIIGAIGVIGPTRLNYARIIPMVDYTSKVIGETVG